MLGTQSWCGDSCPESLFAKSLFYPLSSLSKGQAQTQNPAMFCYFWFSALSGLFPTFLQGIFGGSRASSLQGLGAHSPHLGAALRRLAQGKKQFSHQKALWIRSDASPGRKRLCHAELHPAGSRQEGCRGKKVALKRVGKG